jgi:hypothetical protein
MMSCITILSAWRETHVERNDDAGYLGAPDDQCSRNDIMKTRNEIRDKGNSGERAHAFINPLTALLNFPMLFELLL